MKQRHRASDISFKDKNRRNYRTRAFFVTIVAFVIFGATIAIAGIQKTKDSLFVISSKIFNSKAAVGDTISTIGTTVAVSKKSIIEERNMLQQQVDDLQAQLLSQNVLKDENKKLQEMLGRNGVSKEQILGRIVVKPNHSLYDTLVVDVGSDEGVRVGASVFARGVFTIGTVVETTTHTAKISLFSTSKEKTQAVLVGKDIFVDLIGRGGGTFDATLPRDVEVVKGTEVILPGGNNIIAIAEESIVDSRDPFQKILFRAPVNLFELQFIGIEK